jgi:hypothetical protein
MPLDEAARHYLPGSPNWSPASGPRPKTGSGWRPWRATQWSGRGSGSPGRRHEQRRHQGGELFRLEIVALEAIE